MKALITGAAGFIGSHLAQKLSAEGYSVVGIDRYSDYYSADLKKLRARELVTQKIRILELDVADYGSIHEAISQEQPDIVIHLAAQAGIRLAKEQYSTYIKDNITGFQNTLTAVLENEIPNFVYASSSSVYGDSRNSILDESEELLLPVSYYGKTKLSNEKTAKIWSRNSQTRVRGLRYFTVYGPWGRPDMAYFRLFASALENSKFTLMGDGSVQRDFTYVDDAVEATYRFIQELTTREPGYSDVLNVGGGTCTSLSSMIEEVAKVTGIAIKVDIKSRNLADVRYTRASIANQLQIINYIPSTELHKGLTETFKWMTSSVSRGNLDEWVKSTN